MVAPRQKDVHRIDTLLRAIRRAWLCEPEKGLGEVLHLALKTAPDFYVINDGDLYIALLQQEVDKGERDGC